MNRSPRPFYEGLKKSKNYASNIARMEMQKASIQKIIKAHETDVVDIEHMERKEIMEILGVSKHHVTKARKIMGIKHQRGKWGRPRISTDGVANEILLQTWGRA